MAAIHKKTLDTMCIDLKKKGMRYAEMKKIEYTESQAIHEKTWKIYFKVATNFGI